MCCLSQKKILWRRDRKWRLISERKRLRSSEMKQGRLDSLRVNKRLIIRVRVSG
jgi:hypothetical protein